MSNLDEECLLGSDWILHVNALFLFKNNLKVKTLSDKLQLNNHLYEVTKFVIISKKKIF